MKLLRLLSKWHLHRLALLKPVHINSVELKVTNLLFEPAAHLKASSCSDEWRNSAISMTNAVVNKLVGSLLNRVMFFSANSPLNTETCKISIKTKLDKL